MTLADALRECATDLLQSEPWVSVEQVVKCTRARFPEEFRAEQDRLIEQAARRQAKSILGRFTDDDDEQMELDGIAGLPAAVAVQGEDAEWRYINVHKCTLAHLEAGRKVRIQNVEAAQAKLDEYDEAVAKLRPYMQGGETVSEAVERMAGEQ